MIFLPILVFLFCSPRRRITEGRITEGRSAVASWIFFAAIGLSLLLVLPYGFTEETTSPKTQPETQAAEKFREGTRVVGLSGTFSENGRRWMMHSENGGPPFRILENLTLQRIANAISDDAQDNFWKVSGILTEFQNENFLLIDRIQRGTRSNNNADIDTNQTLTE